MFDQSPHGASAPLLSILIPAYRYADGIRRILSLFLPLPAEDCELIIFDDSPDDEVAAIVGGFMDSGAPVSYRHNRPPLGPAANWNALLDAARGEFCLLLHHDEFPLGDCFLGDLVETLREDPGVDGLMLDCILITSSGGRNRRHLPNWLRAFVVRHSPHYLFRRNVIGPVSGLVVRRTLYPRFDARLSWLIDADVYVRLLKGAKCVRPCPQVHICSVLDHPDSITARLGSAVSQLKHEERAYLRTIHDDVGLWLGPGPGDPVCGVPIRAAETVCWSFMRVLTRTIALFRTSPVPCSAIRQALHSRPKA